MSWVDQNPIVRVGGREYDRRTVADIVVPEGVTQIDDGTFKYCRNLVSISLPNSLTRIGKYAFCVCESLATINIPPSVTHIGDVPSMNAHLSLPFAFIHPLRSLLLLSMYVKPSTISPRPKTYQLLNMSSHKTKSNKIESISASQYTCAQTQRSDST